MSFRFRYRSVAVLAVTATACVQQRAAEAPSPPAQQHAPDAPTPAPTPSPSQPASEESSGQPPSTANERPAIVDTSPILVDYRLANRMVKRRGPQMQLWASGRIRWWVRGTLLEGHLTPTQLRNVMRRISKAGFDSWEPFLPWYGGHQVPDCGYLVLTVANDAGTKTVRANGCHGTPPPFRKLVQFLNSGAGATGTPVGEAAASAKPSSAAD